LPLVILERSKMTNLGYLSPYDYRVTYHDYGWYGVCHKI